jgi:hypothetical protein
MVTSNSIYMFTWVFIRRKSLLSILKYKAMKYLICFLFLLSSIVVFAQPDRPLPPPEGSVNNFYASVVLFVVVTAWCLKLYYTRRKLMKAGLYSVETIYNYDSTKKTDSSEPSFLDIIIENKVKAARKIY